MFGDEDRQRPLLQVIDANQEPKKVSSDVRDVIEQIRHDKDSQRTFLVELMAFKLKQMFEAKLKALQGEQEEEKEEADGEGVEQLAATGEVSVNDKSGTLSANPNKTPAGADPSESNAQTR